MEDEVDNRRARRASLIGHWPLVVGLVIALTPLWHVLSLGSAPTFEVLSQQICTAQTTPRDSKDVASRPDSTGARVAGPGESETPALSDPSSYFRFAIIP
jgi:hypothetical protein